MNRRTTTNDHHHAGGVFNKAQMATGTSTNIRPVITNASYGNPGLLNTNTVTIPTAMGNTIGPGATATLIRPMGYTLPQVIIQEHRSIFVATIFSIIGSTYHAQ